MKVYPWSYKYKNQETVLFWVTTTEKDYFLTLEDGTLLTSSHLLKLDPDEKEKLYDIQWKELATIDFDKFWSSINNLRENRASSTKTSKTILDGWNFIEDMGRTFDAAKLMKRLKTKTMTKAYDKIFFGNNLPSVSPGGKTYNPLWEKEEIETIKKELRSVWKYFQENGYIA